MFAIANGMAIDVTIWPNWMAILEEWLQPSTSSHNSHVSTVMYLGKASFKHGFGLSISCQKQLRSITTVPFSEMMPKKNIEREKQLEFYGRF